MSTSNKLIVILGPTASGKSEMALKLAKKFNGEIISADSRQIYQEMLIATASPFIENQNAKIKMQNDNVKFKNKIIKSAIINKIPHHLLHFVKPNQQFSVADYKELTIKIIRDIQNRSKTPFLVGGTGFYISSITDDLEIPQVPPNKKLRKKLEKLTIRQLFSRLRMIDPEKAKTIDPSNPHRLIRAIEIATSAKKTISKQPTISEPQFNILKIGIDLPRETLYKKIDQRVEKMFEQGLIKETKKLAGKYSWRLPSMSGIGYKQIGMYLRGEITLARAKELIKFSTHHYARRQITWFRRDKNIRWIKNYRQASKLIKRFYHSR